MMMLCRCLLLLALVPTTNAFVTPTTSIIVSPAVKPTTTIALQANNNPFAALTEIFSPKQQQQNQAPAPTLPPVVIDPDYRLAGIFLGLGIFLDTLPFIQFTLGPIVTLLGILFLVQTNRIRFCFDETAFELKIGDDLAKTGDNVVVGGDNRWDYDSFVNWKFFPSAWLNQPQGPVLAYFKETQTPASSWNEGPGKTANSPEAIANGAVPGQVHFFPVLCNAKQLAAEFERRGCKKLPDAE